MSESPHPTPSNTGFDKWMHDWIEKWSSKFMNDDTYCWEEEIWLVVAGNCRLETLNRP